MLFFSKKIWSFFLLIDLSLKIIGYAKISINFLKLSGQ